MKFKTNMVKHGGSLIIGPPSFDWVIPDNAEANAEAQEERQLEILMVVGVRDTVAYACCINPTHYAWIKERCQKSMGLHNIGLPSFVM